MIWWTCELHHEYYKAIQSNKTIKKNSDITKSNKHKKKREEEMRN